MIICKTQSRRSHMAFVVSNCHSLFIPTWSWPTARSRSKFQSCQASKPKLNNRLSFQQVPIIDNLNQNISQEPSRCLLDSSFIATELSPFLNMFWCSLSSPGSVWLARLTISPRPAHNDQVKPDKCNTSLPWPDSPPVIQINLRIHYTIGVKHGIRKMVQTLYHMLVNTIVGETTIANVTTSRQTGISGNFILEKLVRPILTWDCDAL